MATSHLRPRLPPRAAPALSSECEMKASSVAIAVLFPALVAVVPVGRPFGQATARVAAVAADTILPPQMIALGDSIFHGRAGGGLCFTCHGVNAKGTPGLAPDLTDAKWLHGDGTYGFIIGLVTNGVPTPMAAASPMPPKGGARLSEAQVVAVSAFVYTLNRAARSHSR